MYEPHASYMLEAKIWRQLDPRYVVQRLLEAKVKRWAAGIIPAAESYYQQLTQEVLRALGSAPGRVWCVCKRFGSMRQPGLACASA